MDTPRIDAPPLSGRRPWLVYVLSGDPFADPFDVVLTPVGSYRSPVAAFRIARSFALYGELGGWHTQIVHRDLNAALYLEPATIDDGGRPAGVAYRTAGSQCFELAAELAPAFAVIEQEARQ